MLETANCPRCGRVNAAHRRTCLYCGIQMPNPSPPPPQRKKKMPNELDELVRSALRGGTIEPLKKALEQAGEPPPRDTSTERPSASVKNPQSARSRARTGPTNEVRSPDSAKVNAPVATVGQGPPTARRPPAQASRGSEATQRARANDSHVTAMNLDDVTPPPFPATPGQPSAGTSEEGANFDDADLAPDPAAALNYLQDRCRAALVSWKAGNIQGTRKALASAEDAITAAKEVIDEFELERLSSS